MFNVRVMCYVCLYRGMHMSVHMYVYMLKYLRVNMGLYLNEDVIVCFYLYVCEQVYA